MVRSSPVGSARLYRKSAKGCLASRTALCLSQLPPSPTGTEPRSQRKVPRTFFGSSPPCPAALPVIEVKRQSSSCSQYHSEESSARFLKRSSHRLDSAFRSFGLIGFFLAPIWLSATSRRVVQALIR